MIKTWLFTICAISLAVSCKNQSATEKKTGKRVVLRRFFVNTAGMYDTLVISQTTCRGCGYEQLTDMKVEDNLGLIKAETIESYDWRRSNGNGIEVRRDLLLLPVKTGDSTTLMFYRYYDDSHIARDTMAYLVTIQN